MAPRWGSARLAIVPQLAPGIAPAGNALAVDAIEVQVIRPSTEAIVVDQRFPFDPSQSSIQVNVSVPLQSTQETLQVILNYLSGTTLLYSGSQSVTIQAGSTGNQPVNIPVSYAGPGQTATAVTITPRDTLLTSGDALTFAANATASGVPTPVYVGWSTDNGAQAIDANGRIVAALTRAVVKIRVQTPTPPGLKDSTTVRIVPRPNNIVKLSGDAQIGVAGSALALPLVVQVNGSDNLGVPAVRVTFAAATGGGSVDTATVVTDSTGKAGTTVKLGTTAGNQSFTASVTGVTSATFTATATAAGVKTWLGTTTDWNTASNWSPSGVPTATDDVVIPNSTPNPPVPTTVVSAHNVTVGSSAVLGPFTTNLTVTGSVVGAISGPVTMTGAGVTAAGAITDLTVNGTVTIPTSTTLAVNGTLSISGTGSDVALSTSSLSVLTLSTTNGGTLTTTHAADVVTVSGTANFSGGSTAGHLTAGSLLLSGNFQQGSGTSTSSFAPSGTHTTAITGAGTHTVSFASPQSFFNNVQLGGGGGTLSLSSAVVVKGTLLGNASGTETVTSTGQDLQVQGGISLAGGTMVFINTTLTVNSTTNTVLSLANLTFQNMTTTATQLSVSHPGGAAPFSFTNLTFSTTPTTGGLYLSATDNLADANVLTINMVNPNPATPGGFVSSAGGAAVNWGAAPGKSWTGATSGDWNTATNWNPAGVPTNADDVTIPTGSVTLSNTGSAKSLTVAAGATLNIGAFTLAVGGNVFGDGLISSTTGSIQIANTALIRGALPNLILSGAVTLSTGTLVTGNVTLTGAAGNLIIGGQAMTMTGNLTVQSSAVLTMTNSADVISVGGNASFSGGDETGKLTAGILLVTGNFAQSVGATSFVATSGHTTRLGAASTVSFANPTTSTFGGLDVTLGTTGITLNSDVVTNGPLISSSGTPTITSPAGHTLTSNDGVNIFGLKVDRVPLVISDGSLFPFNNVTFTNSTQTGNQLTINHPGVYAWSFDNFTFTVQPTTGHYLVANDQDGPTANGPLTINMNNPSPASPGSFVQATNGAIVNWPGTSGGLQLRTWTGAISTDWSNPGNWSPTGIPGVNDSVVIPQTALAPTDTTTTSVGSLIITGNLSLTLDGGQGVFVSRSVNTGSGSIEKGPSTGQRILILAGSGTVQGRINADISLTGTYSLSDSLISDSVFVFGSLDLNSKQMTSGSFTTANNGILVMTHPTDTLRVVGSASFVGGSTTGKLTDGALLVGGDFQEGGSAVGDAFAPSGNHWTILAGNATQLVSFLHPGGGAGASRFRNLGISNPVTGAITVNTDLYILGQSAFAPTVPTQAVTGNGSVVHLANLFIQDPITFNDVLLAYDAALGGSDSISITNATFKNYDPFGTTPVISISHPGALDPSSGGVMTYFFTNLTFSPVISASQGTANYLSATDTSPTNGIPLTIFVTSNLNNPEGPNHTVTQGGAQVTWSVP